MATALAGCSSTDKQESTGEYIDDAVITSKDKAVALARGVNGVEQVRNDIVIR